jgi:hypothetical protein
MRCGCGCGCAARWYYEMWIWCVAVVVMDWTCFAYWMRSWQDADFYLVHVVNLFASMKVKPGTV